MRDEIRNKGWKLRNESHGRFQLVMMRILKVDNDNDDDENQDQEKWTGQR